jgi:hypothetical protein
MMPDREKIEPAGSGQKPPPGPVFDFSQFQRLTHASFKLFPVIYAICGLTRL